MDLARLIDHTLLKPYCTLEEVKTICQQAIEHRFAAVCIPPFYVKDAAHVLEGKGVKTASVVGFPMGYSAVAAKVEEIKRAIDEGVDELDVVVNLCAVKSGNWNFVRNELESLTTACHMRGKTVKAIIETGVLTDGELLKMCDACAEFGVDFVKTSTGFNGQGVTPEVVSLLRQKLPEKIKIEASGGIRDRQFAEQLIGAAADRIGSSTGVAIVSG